MSDTDLDQVWIKEVYAYSSENIVNTSKSSEGGKDKENKYFANIHHMLSVDIIQLYDELVSERIL